MSPAVDPAVNRAGGWDVGPAWDLDALLDDRGTEIVLVCGSGGVGKTTTAAAIAVRAAERGRRVAVLTVDPARRLSQALGTAPSGGTGGSAGADGSPVPVPGVDTGAGGSLDALVLDVRRTLDQLVDAAVPPERAAAIRANPVYESVASSFSGTQEYMAMERLGQLRAQARAGERPWDLLVVDTPPSRNALDFLDAPRRLSSFLDGRFLRVLLAPARLSGRGLRVVGLVAGGLASVMDRVLGARLLRDVEALVSALDAVFGGFRARAEATYAALADSRTAFVVVAAPEPDPLAEAVFFVRRLRTEGLRLVAVVVNRVTSPSVALPAAAARAAAHALEAQRQEGPAAVLRLHADLAARAEQERDLVTGAVAGALAGGGGAGSAEVPGTAPGAAPSTQDAPPAVAVVGLRRGDVADLPALRAVGQELAGG